MDAETLSKAGKLLYLDREDRSLIRWAYQICLTDMREEHATSFVRSSDIVEKQSPVNIFVILSAHLIV